MAKEIRGRSTDGAVLRQLRYDLLGADSASVMAKILSDISGYKVHREHISAYEHSKRPIPDTLVQAAAKAFKVPVDIFPEYAARHMNGEEAAHPLVAWARSHAQSMSDEEAMQFIGRIDGVEGYALTPEATALRQRGVRAVALPRIHRRRRARA